MITGEGQFGKVYSAVNLDTGDLMAVKQVSLSFLSLLSTKIALGKYRALYMETHYNLPFIFK